MKFGLSLSCSVSFSNCLKLFSNEQCHKIFLKGRFFLIQYMFRFGLLSSLKLCSWCRSWCSEHYSLDSDVLWAL